MFKKIKEQFFTPYNQCISTTDLIAKSFIVIFCLLTVMVYNLSYAPGEDIEYPLEKPFEEYDPYVQQFDAFMKGRISFDYVPDEEFLKLDNPYDPKEREEDTFLYDRAFYDGKYYSYFGTAPIFTVIYPYYFITGKIPSGGIIQSVYLNIFAVFFPLLIMNLIKRFSSRLKPVTAILITYAAYVSSLNLLMGRGDDWFYYIAATSAMAFLSMFMLAFYKGIYSEKFKSRCVYFILAGVSYALCFHSRINVAFTAAFFIIPAVIFGIVIKKREISVKKIWAELCCLGIPVITGFIIYFVYNYVRFDNPLEFGATYQLTVADVSKYSLQIDEFGKAMYCYFIKPIKWLRLNDILVLERNIPFEMDRYLYRDSYFGILVIPFMLFSLTLPFACIYNKRNKAFCITMVASLVGIVVVSWVDFCLGGLIFRYLCDISVIMAVIASISACACVDAVIGIKKVMIRNVFMVVMAFLLVLCIYSALKVTAVSDYNVFKMDNDSLFYKLFH